MNNLKLYIWGGLAFVAFLLLLLVNPFSTNESGYREHVRTISGDEYVRFEPGLYFAGFFATVTEYPDVITVQYGTEDEEGDDVTYFAPPHGVKFNGGDNARIGHTVKWDLPDDEESMLGIHRHYRSHERLASTTLSQFQKETAGYSTQMLDSETHYSGGQSQLKEFFQDQLRFGQILLDKRTQVVVDSITGNSETVITVNPRQDKDGNLLRTESDIQKYGITPSFVSIDHVKYSELIEQKLAAKIESATVKSISEQKLITAQQEAKTAIEEGKKRIEQVKAEKEAEKLQAVIAAQQAKEVAREEALQAKFIADKALQEGRAAAEVARLKVQAGLSPRERAEFEMKTRIGVAAELAKAQMPTIVAGGGSNGTSPLDAVGINMLLQINEKLSKKQ